MKVFFVTTTALSLLVLGAHAGFRASVAERGSATALLTGGGSLLEVLLVLGLLLTRMLAIFGVPVLLGALAGAFVAGVTQRTSTPERDP